MHHEADADCRTLEVAGRRYETIPEELIIKAGLMAASQMMVPTVAPGEAAAPCCGGTAATVPCAPAPGRTQGDCCV